MKRSIWLLSFAAWLAVSAAALPADARDEIVWFCPTTEAIVHGGPIFEPSEPCPGRWHRAPLWSAERDIRARREQEAIRLQEEQQERERKEAEAKAAALAEQRIQKAQAEDAKRQREFAAQRAAAEREEKARQERQRRRVAAQIEEDTRNGYKRSTIDDVILDYRTLPEGTKLVLSGLHYALGQLETFSKGPYSTQVIYLDTTSLSRDTRKLLLKCHETSPYCRMTIWAHTGCVMTSFGNPTDAPCLIVDGLRGGTYEHPVDGDVHR